MSVEDTVLNAAEKGKVTRYLVTITKQSLDLLDKLYLFDNPDWKYDIPRIFRKPVDRKLFPNYYDIITEPMDLSAMKKRVETFKSMYLNATKDPSEEDPAPRFGAQFVNAVLKDMDLIHDNCHTYNATDECIVPRQMADYLRNFFRYCMRVFLLLLKEIALYNNCVQKYDSFLFDDPNIQKLISEPITEDVRTYLNFPAVKGRMEKVIESIELVQVILGANRFPEQLRNSLVTLCEVPLPKGTKPLFTPPPASVIDAAAASCATTAKTTATSAPTSAPSSTKKSNLTVLSINNTNDSSKSVKTPRLSLTVSASKRKLDVISTPADEEDEYAVAFVSPETSAAAKSMNTGNAKKKSRLSKGALSSSSFAQLAAASTDSQGEDDIDAWADSMVDHTTTSAPLLAKSFAASTSASDKKTSRKSISASASAAALVGVSELPSWLRAAEEVIHQLMKHPFVDRNKATVAANFMVPIVECTPSVAAEYLKCIAHPMDFQTLQNLLYTGSFATANDFYLTLRLIFENAIEFNKPNADNLDILRLIVEKSRYLLDYTRWLCLEKLPLDDDNSSNTDSLQPITSPTTTTTSLLTVDARRKARQERMEIVFPTRFNEFQHSATQHLDIAKNPYKECKAVISELTKARNKIEESQVAWFSYPVDITQVPDYCVFVREPMDLSTAHYKLDKTAPLTQQIVLDKAVCEIPYVTYGEYFEDLMRVYNNAIKYNRAFLQSDTTGISKQLFDAATEFKRRLEEVIMPKHLLSLADRISVGRFLVNELERENKKIRERAEQEKRQYEEILKKLIDERKAEDEQFAMDINPELKRLKTEQEIKERERAARRAIVASSNALIGSLSPTADDLSLSSPDHSPLPHSTLIGSSMVNGDALGTVNNNTHSDAAHVTSSAQQRALSLPLVFGFASSGRVPERFASVVEEKRKLADCAWLLWPIARSGLGVAHEQEYGTKAGRSSQKHARSNSITSNANTASATITTTPATATTSTNVVISATAVSAPNHNHNSTALSVDNTNTISVTDSESASESTANKNKSALLVDSHAEQPSESQQLDSHVITKSFVIHKNKNKKFGFTRPRKQLFDSNDVDNGNDDNSNHMDIDQ